MLSSTWREGLVGRKQTRLMLPGARCILRLAHGTTISIAMYVPFAYCRMRHDPKGMTEWRHRILNAQELSWTPINGNPLLCPYWDQYRLPPVGLVRLTNQPRNPQRCKRVDMRPPVHELGSTIRVIGLDER